MMVVALLVADTDVINVDVRGESLLTHAIRGLTESGCVDRVVLVTPPGAESIPGSVPGVECWVPSPATTHADSIRLAFETAESCDVVLVHDAARAFVPPATVRSVVEAVRQGADAVAPVLPVTDTVKLVDAAGVITATEDRARLRTLQTPLGYTPDALREVCARGLDPMSSLPGTVRTVHGHPNALRLATDFDVAVVEALLAEQPVASER